MNWSPSSVQTLLLSPTVYFPVPWSLFQGLLSQYWFPWARLACDCFSVSVWRPRQFWRILVRTCRLAVTMRSDRSLRYPPRAHAVNDFHCWRCYFYTVKLLLPPPSILYYPQEPTCSPHLKVRRGWVEAIVQLLKCSPGTHQVLSVWSLEPVWKHWTWWCLLAIQSQQWLQRACEGRGQILGVHWPVSLAYLLNSRPERDSVQKTKMPQE